jgi:hypothetical protein
MTYAAFAAGLSPTPLPTTEYTPGVCNIGPAEIARRRRAGHTGVLLTVIAFTALVLIDAPPIARLLLVFPAAVAASGYLQAWLRFCAAFGRLGVFNFGDVGGTERVGDGDAKRRDRRRANEIGLASLGVGLVVAVAAFLLPI